MWSIAENPDAFSKSGRIKVSSALAENELKKVEKIRLSEGKEG